VSSTALLLLVSIVGAVLITFGAALLHPAAGYIVAGSFLLAAGLLVDVPTRPDDGSKGTP